MHLTAFSPSSRPATISCDVSAYKLNLSCRELSVPGAAAEWEVPNRTAPITASLEAIRAKARERGISELQVVVEPTGRYHKLILRIARSLGFQTALVDAGHVKKMRAIVFGDEGKTDERDPHAIEAVAAQGRLIPDRCHAEVYPLMRQWGKLYSDAERPLVEAKSRVHCALTILFPDFDFSTDFLYGRSGQAIVRCFGLDPHTLPLRMHPGFTHGSAARASDARRSCACSRRPARPS